MFNTRGVVDPYPLPPLLPPCTIPALPPPAKKGKNDRILDARVVSTPRHLYLRRQDYPRKGGV